MSSQGLINAHSYAFYPQEDTKPTAAGIQPSGRSSLGEFQRSSRRLLPELPNRSQIWSHLPRERRYPEQLPLIFTALSKGSEGSRRPPGDGAFFQVARTCCPGRQRRQEAIYYPRSKASSPNVGTIGNRFICAQKGTSFSSPTLSNSRPAMLPSKVSANSFRTER